jgi:hypothetical protein
MEEAAILFQLVAGRSLKEISIYDDGRCLIAMSLSHSACLAFLLELAEWRALEVGEARDLIVFVSAGPRASSGYL